MTVRFRYSARVLLSLCAGWGALSPVWESQEALSLTAAYDASRVNDATVQSSANALGAATHEDAIRRGGPNP